MLKAVVVYLQGTGGNLLCRSLTLAENTIAYLPEDCANKQPQLLISAKDRFNLYNNWNPLDWNTTEKSIALWYHHGKQDFCNYQDSDLWLIDQFHPVDYENENNKKVLWQTEKVWQHVVLITWQPQSFEHIKKLATLKRTDLNHAQQFPREVNAYNNRVQQHSGLTIAWEDMLDEQSYIREIGKLCHHLSLEINIDMVKQLWQSWFKATSEIIKLAT